MLVRVIPIDGKQASWGAVISRRIVRVSCVVEQRRGRAAAQTAATSQISRRVK